VEVDPQNGTARFTATVKAIDISRPGRPEVWGTGLTMVVEVADQSSIGFWKRAEPDLISITVWDGSTLVSSSHWDGGPTTVPEPVRGIILIHNFGKPQSKSRSHWW
jgi:hypothetical protein